MTTFLKRPFGSTATLSYPQYLSSSNRLALETISEVFHQSGEKCEGFNLMQAPIRSEGSLATLSAVAYGRGLDAGIVQGDAYLEANSLTRKHVKVVAELYDETWLLMTHSGLGTAPIQTLVKKAEASGKHFSIACFSKDGQSFRNLQNYLESIGLKGKVTVMVADYAEAGQLLRERRVDGAFYVCSLSHPEICRIVSEGTVIVHDIAGRDALIKKNNALTQSQIPPMFFGMAQPNGIKSIRTPALLVVCERVSKRSVCSLARCLLRNLEELNAKPFLNVREPTKIFQKWNHAGAAKAYKTPSDLTPGAKKTLAILTLAAITIGAAASLIVAFSSQENTDSQQIVPRNELRFFGKEIIIPYRVFGSAASDRKSS